jgi:hypothetical protein
MRSAREAAGGLKLFDRGGEIDELKAKCLEETGLEAPAAPEFPRFIKPKLEAAPAENERRASGFE